MSSINSSAQNDFGIKSASETLGSVLRSLEDVAITRINQLSQSSLFKLYSTAWLVNGGDDNSVGVAALPRSLVSLVICHDSIMLPPTRIDGPNEATRAG